MCVSCSSSTSLPGFSIHWSLLLTYSLFCGCRMMTFSSTPCTRAHGSQCSIVSRITSSIYASVLYNQRCGLIFQSHFNSLSLYLISWCSMWTWLGPWEGFEPCLPSPCNVLHYFLHELLSFWLNNMFQTNLVPALPSPSKQAFFWVIPGSFCGKHERSLSGH